MAGSLDANALRRSMDLYAKALERHRAELDSINVFPVPDGDTGTNMLLTQRSVISMLASLDGGQMGLRHLGGEIARASLLGARGNSGVILSQVLRGFGERLPDRGEAAARDVAGALRSAADAAVRAVATPRDGTMLSVLEDAAAAAERAAGRGAALPGVVDEALDEARRSLERTRDMLPELRDAGVVDAGGKGVVMLLDSLRAALLEVPLSEPLGPSGPVGARAVAGSAGKSELGFEVQCLLEADELSMVGLRHDLAAIGDSLVIVGGGGLFKVHVHTRDPEAAIAQIESAGQVRDASTVRLEALGEECLGGRARSVRLAQQACALVVATEGEGLDAAFRSLGAVVVSETSPSVIALREALEAAPAEGVVLVPTDPATTDAATGAAEQSAKETRVVAAGSVPAGLAAATAFNPLDDLDTNAASMSEAAGSVRHGAVVAAGPAGLGAPGEGWLGLVDGVVVCSGPSAEEVALDVIVRLADKGPAEIVTVVVGAGANRGLSAGLAADIGKRRPDAEVQVVDGGQPGSRYLIGVE